MFRFIWKLFLLLVVLIIIAPFALVFVSIQESPAVLTQVELKPEHLQRAKAVALENDPRQMEAGELRNASLSEGDLNLLLNYGLTQWGEGGALLNLQNGGAMLDLTVALPNNPLESIIGRYMNLSLEVYQQTGKLKVQRLELGNLSIPRVLAQWMLNSAHTALSKDKDYVAVLDSINGYRFTETRAMVIYQWQPELAQRLQGRGKSVLIPEADRDALLVYARRLAEVSNDPYLDKNVPLSRFLEPLFRLAKERSGSNDPVRENRAVVMALGFYINGTNAARLLGVAEDEVGTPAEHTLTLLGRVDFAQHFLNSAAIAVAGGGKLADAVGLFKEVDDSQSVGGSGFSFNDLAADRAGVRFGVLAVSDAAGAAKVQELMSKGPWESDYMPSVEGLPEFLSAARFKHEYGKIGSPAYNRLKDDIEQRVASCKLHSS